MRLSIETLVAFAQFARRVERREAIVFNERAALAMIVVQVALRRRVQQAPEMIEAMPIMSAHRGVERNRHPAAVGPVADFLQENFTLAEGFDHGLNQFAAVRCGVHRRCDLRSWATTGTW